MFFLPSKYHALPLKLTAVDSVNWAGLNLDLFSTYECLPGEVHSLKSCLRISECIILKRHIILTLLFFFVLTCLTGIFGGRKQVALCCPEELERAWGLSRISCHSATPYKGLHDHRCHKKKFIGRQLKIRSVGSKAFQNASASSLLRERQLWPCHAKAIAT